MKSTFSLSCLILLAASSITVNAQATNYISAAYDSAVEMHNMYEQYVEFFRKSLNVEAADFGLYFTDAMADAIARADPTSVTHGAALQSCAGVAARRSRTSIELFDEAVVSLQAESTRIHLTVVQQLLNTNVKENDLELFYYYHSHRMTALQDRLQDELLPRMYDDLSVLWADYFIILGDMEDCIEAVLAG